MFESIESCVEKLKKEFDVLSVVDCDNITVNDLYLKIKNLWRETFENNQRIIFTLTTDKHNNRSGIILHSIQTILNTVDISNFFACIVTTNTNINDEYKYLLDNVSRDKVLVHIYQCKGNYAKLMANNNELPFEKYADIVNNIKDIANLSAEDKFRLFESKSFCIMPWIGINIEPDSTVKPCCESYQTIGDCSKQSLDYIWNSDQIKNIRAGMLKNIAVDSCSSCYEKEKIGRDSLRQSTNRRFADKITKLKQTEQDGKFKEFKLHYWDIRYNNLCNLACRSCRSVNSSSLYQVEKSLGKLTRSRSALLIAGSKNYDVFSQIIQHIDDVETIYFAGGEPLIIDQFYEILELLDQKRRYSVQLLYNINLTRITLKEKSIFDLWKKFPNISVGASLDGSGTRGEYLRSGLVWEDVIKNRAQMIKECPHVDFYISATVSILNILHLPDFHKECVDLGLIDPKDFNIQLLFDPKWLTTDQMPPELKTQVIEKYLQHLDWLEPIDTLGRASYGFRSIINHIENAAEMDYETFWKTANELDQYHGTDLLKVFPELSILKDKLL